MIESMDKVYNRPILTLADVEVVVETAKSIARLDHVGTGTAIEVLSEDYEYPVGHWVLMDDFWGFIAYDSNSGDTSVME